MRSMVEGERARTACAKLGYHGSSEGDHPEGEIAAPAHDAA